MNISTHELGKDRNGGTKFYQSLSAWIKRCTKDSYERRIIKQMILERELREGGRQNWTLDEWVEEYKKHPGWDSKIVSKIAKDEVNGGKRFYRKLSNWIRRDTKNPHEIRKIMQMIGLKFKKDYKNYMNWTFDQWTDYLTQHPKWKEMSTEELKTDRDSYRFYINLSNWIKKDIKNPGEMKTIKRMVGMNLKKRYVDRTFDQWVEEYNDHPMWKTMSMYCLQCDNNGGAIFYRNLTKWVKNNSKSTYERRITKQMILGKKLKEVESKNHYLMSLLERYIKE